MVDIDAGATAANFVLLYGNIREADTIVDRVGTQMRYQPLVVGSNQRPTGQVGWYLFGRACGGLVNSSAAVCLSIQTTA